MKKLLLAFCTIVLLQINSIAQTTCTPDPAIGSGMMYPAELPFAMAGYYYYSTLTFRVPADSTIEVGGSQIKMIIDSAQMVYVGGLPKGFGVFCTPKNCTWKGGTLGCALFMGDEAPDSLVGEYPIKMYVQSWVRIAINNERILRVDSSDKYVFKILPFNGGIEIEKGQALKVFPNPASNQINIELQDVQAENNMIEIMDLTGRVVYQKVFSRPDNSFYKIEVNTENFVKGLYSVRLQSDEKSYKGKVLLK